MNHPSEFASLKYCCRGRTSNAGNGLTSRKIGDMDEGVVEGGEDASNTENELALSNLGTERNGVLGGLGLDFLGGLSLISLAQGLESTNPIAAIASKRHPNCKRGIHRFPSFQRSESGMNIQTSTLDGV